MKPKEPKDYERRAKDTLKKLILRFQDYEESFSDDFELFLKDPAVKRNLMMLQAYLKD